MIDADDIGGIVRGPSGPEAGVWVIAETDDLPTKFASIVVTDDVGRYVVPDLPRARYQVWVRGYGLADAPKVNGEPGQLLHLTAVPARDETEAARVYPAIYWYSMLKIPDASAFGMVGGGEKPGVCGLSSIGTVIHAHAFCHARDVQIRRRGMDAARAVGAGGAAHGEPARR